MYKYSMKPPRILTEIGLSLYYDESKEKDSQIPELKRCGYAKPMQKRNKSYIQKEVFNENQNTTSTEENNQPNTANYETKPHEQYQYAKPFMHKSNYSKVSLTKESNNLTTTTQMTDEVVKNTELKADENLRTKSKSNITTPIDQKSNFLNQTENVSQTLEKQTKNIQAISQKLTDEIISSDDIVSDQVNLEKSESTTSTCSTTPKVSDCDFTKLKELLQNAILNIDYAKIAVSFFLLLVNLLLLNPYFFVLLILALIVYVMYLIFKYCACQEELKCKLCSKN